MPIKRIFKIVILYIIVLLGFAFIGILNVIPCEITCPAEAYETAGEFAGEMSGVKKCQLLDLHVVESKYGCAVSPGFLGYNFPLLFFYLIIAPMAVTCVLVAVDKKRS